MFCTRQTEVSRGDRAIETPAETLRLVFNQQIRLIGRAKKVERQRVAAFTRALDAIAPAARAQLVVGLAAIKRAKHPKTVAALEQAQREVSAVSVLQLGGTEAFERVRGSGFHSVALFPVAAAISSASASASAPALVSVSAPPPARLSTPSVFSPVVGRAPTVVSSGSASPGGRPMSQRVTPPRTPPCLDLPDRPLVFPPPAHHAVDAVLPAAPPRDRAIGDAGPTDTLSPVAEAVLSPAAAICGSCTSEGATPVVVSPAYGRLLMGPPFSEQERRQALALLLHSQGFKLLVANPSRFKTPAASAAAATTREFPRFGADRIPGFLFAGHSLADERTGQPRDHIFLARDFWPLSPGQTSEGATLEAMKGEACRSVTFASINRQGVAGLRFRLVGPDTARILQIEPSGMYGMISDDWLADASCLDSVASACANVAIAAGAASFPVINSAGGSTVLSSAIEARLLEHRASEAASAAAEAPAMPLALQSVSPHARAPVDGDVLPHG